MTLSFGSHERLERSLDIEVEGSFLQSGRSTTSYLRRDVGPNPFRDASAQATLWPGIGLNGEDAIAMPIAYTHRRLDYDTGPGTGGFTSYQIASGIGIHPHAMMEISGHLGGAWLWDNGTGRELSAFTFSTTMGFTYFDDGYEDPDHIGGGLGVARRAGYLADGSALTWGWRIEAFADVALLKGRTGGRFRMAVEQLSIPGGPAEPRDLGFQSSFSTEWFLVPVSMLQIGIHHMATGQCPGSAALAGEAFCHSVGGFLRVTDRSWAEASEEPAASLPNHLATDGKVREGEIFSP